MKCLAREKVEKGLKGNVLHDCHAEILALRTFNRALVEECMKLARDRDTHMEQQEREEGQIVRLRRPRQPKDRDTEAEVVEAHAHAHEQPFEIRENIRLHLYCSEAPCGDASMELTMALQEDATPWAAPAPTPTLSPATATILPTDALHGRSYFSHLGIVRRKPSRPDAPPTFSKSCSDKLALAQCTSVLSGLAAVLIHPANAYLCSIVLPESQYVAAACERAFAEKGRMDDAAALLSRRAGGGRGYRWEPFVVKTTAREFQFSRRSSPSADATTKSETEVKGTGKLVPSNLSTLAFNSTQETLINGVLQGRRQDDPRGASSVSRRGMWEAACQVARHLDSSSTPDCSHTADKGCLGGLRQAMYGDLKRSSGFSVRREVKLLACGLSLKGWVANSGDEEWALE
ncbi:hypothetical protein M8818_002925 [Zalaria obscura]|uniref:Uncharacterized protein n=1 Tax=Zalaria obscura TaxID=2024903 RepID=A0ACC3SHV9_9PEZI